MKKETKLLPGDFAIWIIIFAELLVFGIFFITYAFVRINHLEMFNHYQQTLNQETGVINTLLLITASFFIVKAVAALKKDQIKNCYSLLYASIVCGGGFLLIKSVEFYEKFNAGIDLSSNTFYMFYFLLTLFHYFHAVLGVLILIVVASKVQRQHYDSTNTLAIESAGTYWHMVDLAWIVLFPLVYIMR